MVWIYTNMPSEIKHILRLSRLMEYASPEQDFNYGSLQESIVKEHYRRLFFEIRHDTDIWTDMKHSLCVDKTSLAITF